MLRLQYPYTAQFSFDKHKKKAENRQCKFPLLIITESQVKNCHLF